MNVNVEDYEQYGDNSFIWYLECGHRVIRYFAGVEETHDCKLCDRDAAAQERGVLDRLQEELRKSIASTTAG